MTCTWEGSRWRAPYETHLNYLPIHGKIVFHFGTGPWCQELRTAAAEWTASSPSSYMPTSTLHLAHSQCITFSTSPGRTHGILQLCGQELHREAPEMAGLGAGEFFLCSLIFCHSSPNWPQRWSNTPSTQNWFYLPKAIVVAVGRRTEVVPVGTDVSRVSALCPRLQDHHSHGSSGKKFWAHHFYSRCLLCRRPGSNTRPLQNPFTPPDLLAACGHWITRRTALLTDLGSPTHKLGPQSPHDRSFRYRGSFQCKPGKLPGRHPVSAKSWLWRESCSSVSPAEGAVRG